METTNFDIQQYVLDLVNDSPFYAEISRHIDKKEDLTQPTCCVYWDKKNDAFKMLYNSNFLMNYTNQQIKNVLIHEFNHIIFQHLTYRVTDDIHRLLWNYATDCAINSIIFDDYQRKLKNANSKKLNFPLPGFALIPGFLPWNEETNSYETSGNEFQIFVSKLPKLLTSEEYYLLITKFFKDKLQSQKGKGNKLKKGGNSGIGNSEGNEAEDGEDDENEDSDGNQVDDEIDEIDENGVKSFDSHDKWNDDISAEDANYVEAYTKTLVQAAVKKADECANGWGNMNNDVILHIRKYVSTSVDWKNVLRNFLGTILPAGKKSTIRKVNKRFPYILPGKKRNRVPRILIAIDESASVSDEVLTLFFAELSSLAKICEFDLIPFSVKVDEKNLITWKKGKIPEINRVYKGGTDFDCVVDYVNKKENISRWNGLLMLTDGECNEPGKTKIKRAWVLQPGANLMFTSTETVIKVEKQTKFNGAWR